MSTVKYYCVYFKSLAEADDMRDALKTLGMHAVSIETLSTSLVEHMAEALQSANEMMFKAWELNGNTDFLEDTK